MHLARNSNLVSLYVRNDARQLSLAQNLLVLIFLVRFQYALSLTSRHADTWIDDPV